MNTCVQDLLKCLCTIKCCCLCPDINITEVPPQSLNLLHCKKNISTSFYADVLTLTLICVVAETDNTFRASCPACYTTPCAKIIKLIHL